MLDTKKMLLKILTYIKDAKNPTSFTGTRASAVANGNCYGVYDKSTGLVRINLYAGSSANISIDQTLFTIPSAYRPSSAVSGSGFLGTSSGTSQASLTLYTDGTIKQRSTSSCRVLFGYIEYKL